MQDTRAPSYQPLQTSVEQRQPEPNDLLSYDKTKYKVEVISTPDRVAEALLLYAETAKTNNPFIAALGLDTKVLYEESMKPKIQAIADQQLSVGLYEISTGELISANIGVDFATDFKIELKSNILKARAEMFRQGKEMMFKETGMPIFGECVEMMFAVTKPKYQNSKLFYIMDDFTVRHHLKRGYEHRYAEVTAALAQYLFELLEVPFKTMRIYYKDFEYLGEKVYEKMDFGSSYMNGEPCVMFYYIKSIDYLEGGLAVVRRAKKNARPKF